MIEAYFLEQMVIFLGYFTIKAKQTIVKLVCNSETENNKHFNCCTNCSSS